jgi:thiamine pyrophosphate-dependent acetolactate synthase large subunit-like protein
LVCDPQDDQRDVVAWLRSSEVEYGVGHSLGDLAGTQSRTRPKQRLDVRERQGVRRRRGVSEAIRVQQEAVRRMDLDGGVGQVCISLGAQHDAPKTSGAGDRLSAADVFAALSEIRPANAVLVEEAPSNHAELHEAWPITEPDTFYTFASGGLGWDLPASVGIALAERETGRNRPVVAIIGDGSFQYSVQSIWSAAQLQLPILIVIMRNRQYTILKSFAELEQTPGVPSLDLPGMDFVSIAHGYGCDAARIEDLGALKQAAANAWTNDVPTVLEVSVSGQVPPLV